VTISDMAKPKHEQPLTPRRDHLWVAVIIAACVLLEVWASWLWIGSVSGFPKLGPVTTGWILPVATEAYWAYALWTWLVGAPGSRSKRFAMWTAGFVFVLSLIGQESGHLLASSHQAVPPAYVVAFVTALPLVSLALIGILVHLRQADREEASAVARTAAEADELTALQAELDAEREAHGTAVRGLEGKLAGEQEARAKAEQEAAQRPAIEADRDRLRGELRAAREAAETAGTARTRAAREAAAAVAEAGLRQARCGELETALAAAAAELRTVREARENEALSLRGSLETERRARVDVERNAVLLPVIEQQLAEARAAADAANAARETAETARAEAEQRAARAEARAASLTRKPVPAAGSRSTRSGAPAEAPAGRTELEVARAAREDADAILAKEPDISGAKLAERVGMSERWGQTYKKAFAERSLGETG
jgi:hypothetical protein